MAKESVAELYLRLGLNYDDLNSDFVNVENTIQTELTRLNQQSSLINIKAAIDLTGVTDAEQKLSVEQQKLNQQIELQTQKLKLLETAWKSAIDKNGEASRQALNAEKAFRQQELAVKRLEQQLKELNSQQSQKSSNSLLDSYNSLKGNIPSSISDLINSFSNVKGATDSADGAITKFLGSIGNIPTTVTAAVSVLAQIPSAVKAIENGLLDLAKPAIETGDAFYVMSRGMQVSIADAAKLSTICKVTGIEISEVNSTMRRFSAQLNKAGDKDTPMLKMLERFGAQVRDSNGNIKDEIQLIGELSKAWENALAAGESAKFRDIVGGRFWSGDFITFLEDYQANAAAAADIVKNKLSDPKRAHDIQGSINAMNTQAAQLGSAFSSALMPVAEQIVPKLTERMGELTSVIADNAEGIKNIGMAVGEVVVHISSLATEITKLAAESTKLMLKTPTGAVVDKYKNDYSIQNARDLTDKILQDSYNDAQRFVIQNSPQQYSAMIKQNEDAFQSIKKLREEVNKTQKSWADFRNETDKKINIQELSEESLKRIEKYNEELERLKLDLSFGKDDYGKSLAELDLEYRKAYEKAKDFKEELISLDELYAAKRLLIERSNAEKIQKIREDSEKRTNDLLQEAANINTDFNKSPFEKRIAEIERWREKAIDSLKQYQDALKNTGQLEQEAAAINANALAKQREAFEREMDRIRGKVQSLEEKIFEQDHSQRDIDIMRVQKQYADYLKEGIYSKDRLDYWREGELAKIRERASKDTSGDYSKSPNLSRHNAGAPQIIYPDVSDLPTTDFFGDIQQKADAYANEIADLTDSTKGLNDAQSSLADSLQLIEGDKIISSFTNSVNGVVDAQDFLAEKTKQYADNLPIEDAGNELARALRETAKKIEESGGNLSLQAMSQQADSLIDNDKAQIAKNVFDMLEVGGGAVAVGGGATLNPIVAAGGGIAALLGTIGNKALEHMDIPDNVQNFQNDFNPTQSLPPEFSQTLSDLLTATQGIAENVQQIASKEPAQNITVSPNINIDLGGAYVFDNELKAKLTDDIVTEVANAIRDAVQSEVSNTNYGYGN